MIGAERGDPSSLDERSHDGLLRLLVVALSARAALSLADAASLAGTGVGFLHLGGVAQVDSSPPWALLWGSLALAATVLLARRRALGWVFGAAVCVVYLVVGVSQAVMWDVAAGSVPLGAWLVFGADIVAPALVLAGMFAVRPWFLAHARHGPRRLLVSSAPATASPPDEAERRRP